MRKVFLIVSGILIVLSGVMFFYFSDCFNANEEKTISVLSYYGTIVEEKAPISLNLYSNKKDSELLYTQNATLSIYNENIHIEPVFKSIEIVGSAIYENGLYYNYELNVLFNTNEIYIKDAFCKISFPNKEYIFSLGTIEIIKIGDYEPLNLESIWGLSYDKPYLSLAGININLNDRYKMIEMVNIGTPFHVYPVNGNLNDTNEIKDIIDDYNYHYQSNGFLSLDGKNVLLIISYDEELYLANTFMLLRIDNKDYYLYNYNYLKSNDLDARSVLINEGVINAT